MSGAGVRHTAFGFLVLLGLLGVGGITELVLVPYGMETAHVATAQASLAALEKRKAAIDAAMSRLPALDRGIDSRLDRSGSVDDALQRFQERIRAALTSIGGTPILSQTATESVGEDLTALRLLLRAQLTETGLMHLLQTLESGNPQIAVSALDLRSEAGGHPGRLDLNLTLMMFHSNAL